jgi:hypothetical protein
MVGDDPVVFTPMDVADVCLYRPGTSGAIISGCKKHR